MVHPKRKILFTRPYNESQCGSKQHWTPLIFIVWKKKKRTWWHNLLCSEKHII